MNAHKSKLLFKSIVCPPVCFCPLIGCVLIPPPLGFLTTFFVQNLKFSKSFHMNPELEVIKLFWICKMTNTRRSYNCTFALLNRESVWTGRVLIPPPLGLFRVKIHKSYIPQWNGLIFSFWNQKQRRCGCSRGKPHPLEWNSNLRGCGSFGRGPGPLFFWYQRLDIRAFKCGI